MSVSYANTYDFLGVAYNTNKAKQLYIYGHSIFTF